MTIKPQFFTQKFLEIQKANYAVNFDMYIVLFMQF